MSGANDNGTFAAEYLALAVGYAVMNELANQVGADNARAGLHDENETQVVRAIGTCAIRACSDILFGATRN